MNDFDKSHAIDPQILEEAADWAIKFQSGEANENDRLTFESWHKQSAAHTAAWHQIQSVLNAFKQVKPEIGCATFKRAGQFDRRQAVKTLGLLILVLPLSSWMAWRHLPWKDWTADVRTAIGEQKTMDLADGTRLVLNTASTVDIVISKEIRLLTLHSGEIYVTTGNDPAVLPRPLIVQTPQGTVKPIGTQFSVRRFDECTRVAVFQDAVEILPFQASAAMLHAGQQIDYRVDGIQSLQSVEASAASWTQGTFIAKHVRLADLVNELGRYRSGIIRCHPDVADIRVSGTFPIRDIDTSLKFLEETLPLHVSSFSRYWVTIDRQ